MKTEDEVTIGIETSTMINVSTEIIVHTHVGEMIAKRGITIKEIIVLTPLSCIIDIIEIIAKTTVTIETDHTQEKEKTIMIVLGKVVETEVTTEILKRINIETIKTGKQEEITNSMVKTKTKKNDTQKTVNTAERIVEKEYQENIEKTAMRKNPRELLAIGVTSEDTTQIIVKCQKTIRVRVRKKIGSANSDKHL